MIEFTDHSNAKKQKNEETTPSFPLIEEIESVEEVMERTNELLQSAHHNGAVLIRRLPLQTARDFDALVQAFKLPNFPYEKSLSNAVRINRTERVFTANEAPPETTIPLHHEMAQTPFYPTWVFFFCEQAPETGGATPICHSGQLWKALEKECPGFARDCEVHGLRYTNTMPSQNDTASGLGRSWCSTFSVEKKEEAENRLKELGYTWKWLKDECLRVTTPVLPAVLETNGQKTFFNQLIAAFHGWKDSRNDPSKSITFGNGTPIDTVHIEKTSKLAEKFTYDLDWQSGELCIIDNRISMHGRKPFTGKRSVLASMS